MVPPDHALPHRAHEEDRSVATQTSRAHPQLLPCPKAVFQRRCRGPEQQSQSHYEKILRIPYLPRPRTRPLSFTCEVARARDHPRFLLTNLLIGGGVWVFFLRQPPPCGLCRGRWVPRNEKLCWPAFMRRDFKTVRRLRFMPRCSTKAGIIARFALCTGFWKARARRVSAATNSCIRLTRNPSCWPPGPTSSGAGISRNCSALRSGHTSTST